MGWMEDWGRPGNEKKVHWLEVVAKQLVAYPGCRKRSRHIEDRYDTYNTSAEAG